MVASFVTAFLSGHRQRAAVTWSLAVSAVLLATLRFGLAVYSGRHELVYGDYAATLPGGYAERLNPKLWDSPDLAHSWAFHEHSYLHGPTQFLVLYPLVFLDSYAEIARLLLIVYPFVVWAAVYVLWRMLSDAEGRAVSFAAVYASTLAFFPMIQAYAQREFEIVISFAAAVMFWGAVRNRENWVGGAVAFITWFKYLPITLMPYVALRRWTRAILWFAWCSAGMLLVAHLLFDLRHFIDNLVPSVAAGHISLILGRVDFCTGANPAFRAGNRTFAGVRWALCTLQDAGVPIRPLPMYLTIVALVAIVASVGFIRIERRPAPLSPWAERWRRVLELSLIVTVYTTFLFTHYYYLSVLAIPMAALLIRFLCDRRWLSLGVWFATYTCLSTFTVPVGVIDKLLRVHPWQFDAWKWYMRHVVYFPGELLLLALLLREYVTLPQRTTTGA